MKTGWLVYNESLISQKFDDVYDLYIKAAKQCNVILELISSTSLSLEINGCTSLISEDVVKPDFVLFFDKDIKLAKFLESLNYNVFNSSDVIESCDDKSLTLLKLSNHNLRIPKTIIAPMNFTGAISEAFNEYVIDTLKFPLVIKESFGSFGQQVYLVKNINEFNDIQKQVINKPHLYQQFIHSSYGRDVRVYVSFGKVVLSILRTHSSDFRANVSIGGKMEVIQATKEFEQMAIDATKLLNAHFTGVDILFGENDEPILCEVNSNAHIKNAYDVSNINVAISIIEGIINEIRDHNL